MHSPFSFYSYVVDFIRALLKPDFGELRAGVLDWLFAEGFAQECVKLLGPEYSGPIQDNAMDVLIVVGAASKELTLNSRPLESEVRSNPSL